MSVALGRPDVRPEPGAVRAAAAGRRRWPSRRRERSNAVGMGAYAQDDVLLRRFPRDADLTLESLAPPPHESEALLLPRRRLPVGLSLEENTQPFRSRRWLFAHQGSVTGFDAAARRAAGARCRTSSSGRSRGDGQRGGLRALPQAAAGDWGARMIRALEAEVAGRLLAETARELSKASAAGGRRAHLHGSTCWPPTATSWWPRAWATEPLYYTRLEGTDRCEAVRHHARHARDAAGAWWRTGAGARWWWPRHLRRPAGWVELTEGTTLAVESGPAGAPPDAALSAGSAAEEGRLEEAREEVAGGVEEGRARPRCRCARASTRRAARGRRRTGATPGRWPGGPARRAAPSARRRGPAARRGSAGPGATRRAGAPACSPGRRTPRAAPPRRAGPPPTRRSAGGSRGVKCAAPAEGRQQARQLRGQVAAAPPSTAAKAGEEERADDRGSARRKRRTSWRQARRVSP